MKKIIFDETSACLESKGIPLASVRWTIKGGECLITEFHTVNDYLGPGLFAELFAAVEDRLYSGGTETFRVMADRADIELFESVGFAPVGVASRRDGRILFPMAKSLVFKGCDFLEGEDCDALFIRQDFSAGKPEKATLYYTCFGFADVTVNGLPVTEDVMTPPFAAYEARDLSGSSYPILNKMSCTAYYMRLDVTDLVRPGENRLALHMGPGWYGNRFPRVESMPRWGQIKCAFRLVLEYADGTEQVVRSDAGQAYRRRSFVLASRMHAGEVISTEDYDAEWVLPGVRRGDPHAIKAKDPVSFFRLWEFTPDRVTEVCEPAVIWRQGDRKIYDLGAQHSGREVIKFLNSDWEDTAIVRFSEEINDDFTLNFASTGGTGRIQRDVFINSPLAAGLELRPYFLWHAGRYIEVIGNAEIVRFEDVHTDLKVVADYSSASPELQWLYDAFVRTELMNVHGCVPSDCPHRERLGYTGDGQLSCRAVMRVFDARDMYRRWMRDVADCQDIFGGHVQHTAPFYGGGGGPGGWGGAVCIVPLAFYEVYGSDELLREYYDHMRLYLEYMIDHSENCLVVSEEPEGWCLGDWCVPTEGEQIPDPLINTYFFIKCAAAYETAADMFGRGDDAAWARDRIRETKDAFTAAYYDPETGHFASGLNGADAFALDLGLGDGRLPELLRAQYDALGEYDTGIFGTDVVTRMLIKSGSADVARKLLTSHGTCSFYNMQRQGATTLWEYWTGEHSHCHPMFGAVVEYLVEGLIPETDS